MMIWDVHCHLSGVPGRTPDERMGQLIGFAQMRGGPAPSCLPDVHAVEIARFYVEEVVRPGRETLAAVIQRGIDRGEFRAVDTRAVADLLAAPMLMISMWRNALEPCCDERIDPEALIGEHIEMLSRGLAKEAA